MKKYYSLSRKTKVVLILILVGLFASKAHSQCTFGNENPGFTTAASFGSNYILGVSYNCPTPMTITSLNLYGLGTNSQVQMALYSDNNGVPNNLLAESVVGVVGNGVLSLSIPSTTLAAGNYWIMAIYPNDGTGNGHTYYSNTSSKTVYYQGLTFGSPLPTNASGFTSYTGQDFHYWASGNNATATDTRTECDSYTWIDGNTYNSNNNTATHTITGAAANGCDSVVMLDLTILNSASGIETRTECDSYTWIDGNTYTSSNNSATHNIAGGAANGCDSLVTLDLTILNPATGVDTRTECDSYTWIDGNTYTSSNNTATYNIAGGAANGCDSLVSLDLTILNPATGVDTRTECDSYTWIDGNTYTSSNNTATYNITGGATNGCDSLVSLNLIINSVSDVSTSTNELTISANNANGTYTWLDCDDNWSIISGETGQSFTATQNGNYAVAITENGCTDTSDCVAITTVGIIENDFSNDFSIYPNPTNRDFSIDLGSDFNSIKILITDITGKTIHSESFTHSQHLNLSLDAPSGVYLVTIKADNNKAVIRLVKE